METEEIIEIKERIAQSAFELFCQRGIRSVSMDDIAQHLAMSKKTIYKWFANKDEVVFYACEGFLKVVEKDCEAALKGAHNAIEELWGMMEMTRHILVTIHPSIFHDVQKYYPGSWELWLNHKYGFMLDKVKLNILRGVAEGLYRGDLDVEIMGRMRLGMIELAFDTRLFPPHEFDLQKVQQHLLEHYMLGMATIRGHKMINEYKHITEEE
ncbi:TetR family transcriptional regulator [Pontibacter ummariensis]|uniref:Transcriptional regulator, TetR family n=1 Tax=Pontibacter ummariensis TaxID=1610492 RepID=A0A239L0R9_9BACT|nr:TetR/AcrR family transcriptional regulator [Pontibacter ummariensis]PRY04610.1 TetR family transcriptional regulator [Pontibacter ummariensis]SNT24177.1 transcriptional regulator, TetR family [Pontibacter ummariensis]